MTAPASRTYLTPRALCEGTAARDLIVRGEAWPLCTGGGFTAVEITQVADDTVSSTVMTKDHLGAEHEAALGAFFAPRPSFAGVDLARPTIMGIVNVTPDSFSDGGRYADTEAAIAHGISLLEAGAAIVDVGGESTRPGAAPISPDDERKRVIPVIKALAERGAKVSVDTRHATTMADAIAAGAVIVNDVTALADEGALEVVAKSGVAVILMHMQGEPGTMQKNPTYVWAPGDVYDALKARVQACLVAGLPAACIAVDPGIGFGKTDAHNAALFDHLAMFHGLGCALALGASRKSFIGRVSAGEAPTARGPGSLAAALYGVSRGAQILRMHDVAETRQALAVWSHISAS